MYLVFLSLREALRHQNLHLFDKHHNTMVFTKGVTYFIIYNHFFCTCFVQVTTFLDYIRGGVKLHLVAAIDFTTSNGKPSDPHSLHHYNPQGTSSHENPYTMAIRTIGDIFQGIIFHQEISAVVSLPLYCMLKPSKQELD